MIIYQSIIIIIITISVGENQNKKIKESLELLIRKTIIN